MHAIYRTNKPINIRSFEDKGANIITINKIIAPIIVPQRSKFIIFSCFSRLLLIIINDVKTVIKKN